MCDCMDIMLLPLQGNVGDSRAIASVDGAIKELSYDHKPNRKGVCVRIRMYVYYLVEVLSRLWTSVPNDCLYSLSSSCARR